MLSDLLNPSYMFVFVYISHCFRTFTADSAVSSQSVFDLSSTYIFFVLRLEASSFDNLKSDLEEAGS